MTTRPISLILAVGLLLLIGLSGMGVGGSLLGYGLDPQSASATAIVPGAQQAAVVLGAGIAGYGFATVVAAAGLVLLRRWGWRLGVATVVAGLVGLAGAMVAAGALDGLLLFGILFWGVSLATLLADPTRRAVDA
ncbi:MAG TPA: hypothetical protein VFK35_02505 [Candidatus Limnocylindrales bacterium]|nr:hypothetical protein [Candidatus Limnocylindrales bacterium]